MFTVESWSGGDLAADFTTLVLCDFERETKFMQSTKTKMLLYFIILDLIILEPRIRVFRPIFP